MLGIDQLEERRRACRLELAGLVSVELVRARVLAGIDQQELDLINPLTSLPMGWSLASPIAGWIDQQVPAR